MYFRQFCEKPIKQVRHQGQAQNLMMTLFYHLNELFDKQINHSDPQPSKDCYAIWECFYTFLEYLINYITP